MNEQALPTIEIVDMREELRDGIDQCFLRRRMKKIASIRKERTNGTLFK